MKKGRHRRFEEARKAKRAFIEPLRKCEECGGNSEEGHASWCMAYLEEEEELFEPLPSLHVLEDGPARPEE
ncbi:MAG: hypothetical protein ACP5O0_04190 [Acidimicrobiales bacterium]